MPFATRTGTAGSWACIHSCWLSIACYPAPWPFSGAQARIDYSSYAHDAKRAFSSALFYHSTPKCSMLTELELLAPNQRPQQLTTDITGFGLEAIKPFCKELRGRYPKHAWPINPNVDDGENRPKRKSLANRHSRSLLNHNDLTMLNGDQTAGQQHCGQGVAPGHIDEPK